jgi:hypothetical protein
MSYPLINIPVGGKGQGGLKVKINGERDRDVT